MAQGARAGGATCAALAQLYSCPWSFSWGSGLTFCSSAGFLPSLPLENLLLSFHQAADSNACPCVVKPNLSLSDRATAEITPPADSRDQGRVCSPPLTAPLTRTWSPSCSNSVGAAPRDQMQERASWADMKLVERQEAHRPLQPLPLGEERRALKEESSLGKDRLLGPLSFPGD